MLFLRKERDRFAWFLSDGGVRSNLDRERFVEIDIDLPPIPVQRKYVDAYNAMLANQRAYERDLEGLKLTCDVYIERLRRELPREAIGDYIQLSDERNGAGLGVERVRGLSVRKEMIETEADMTGDSLIVTNSSSWGILPMCLILQGAVTKCH